MQSIVMAEGLTKLYGDFKAVDNINFSVEEGEVFGFLGPNGAGKTTTMKMIQCVSPKTSGKLIVAGMEVDDNERDIKKIIGVAPQEMNLDPDFTTFDNLKVYARYFDIPQDEAKERIEKLLDFVQLWDKKDVNIEKLSGGMKRRLILARSLINNPKLLLLDEPTIGLDPQAKHLIWQKLHELKKEGVTIILTTHYMEEAAQLCDTLVIMNNGKIIVRGRPNDLVKMHAGSNIVETEKNPQVIKCLNDMQITNFEESESKIQVFTEQPKEVISMLIKKCKVSNVSSRSVTLEDVFLKLTGRKLME
jgi:lipooligosaccharide transport system ATP-binding protein